MRKAGVLILGILALVGKTWGAGPTFADAPPTRGFHRPTAYPLTRGETQVQLFAFSSPTNPLAFFEVEYGVSDSFQIGFRPIAAFFGDLRGWGKVHVGTTGAVSLAIPFGVEVWVPSWAWALHGGWVLSWRVLPFLTLHPGIDLAFSPGMSLQAYGSADLDLGWYLKLIVELDGEPPYVHVGLLAWVWGVVLFRVDTPLPTLSLRVSLTGRF
ncbi:MAG: hypothetical protein N2320_06050 [Candidatus Bipolaricaulota bacterium]|nr:hypothetical protein [Candidatus Bipolaricaulota bacterium]